MKTRFTLKSLDGPDTDMTVDIGWDGDISITIWDINEKYNIQVPHTIRIGIGPNSGDPNENIEGIQYIKGALRSLAKEFQYQDGKISKEEIEKYRNAPKVLPSLEAWYN